MEKIGIIKEKLQKIFFRLVLPSSLYFSQLNFIVYSNIEPNFIEFGSIVSNNNYLNFILQKLKYYEV